MALNIAPNSVAKALSYVGEELSFIKNHTPRLPGGHKARVAREYLFSVLDDIVVGRESLEHIDKELLDAKLFFGLDGKSRYSIGELMQQSEKSNVIYVADKKSEATDFFQDSGVVVINTEKRYEVRSLLSRIAPIVNLSSALPTRLEENPSEKEKEMVKALDTIYNKGKLLPVRVNLGYIDGDVGNKVSAQNGPDAEQHDDTEQEKPARGEDSGLLLTSSQTRRYSPSSRWSSTRTIRSRPTGKPTGQLMR